MVVTTKQMPTRYGILQKEKIKINLIFMKRKFRSSYQLWIFVLNKNIFQYLNNTNLSFEKDILTKISQLDMLSAYQHNDFWQSMDTLREKLILEDLWNKNKAPWKIWKN